MKKICCICKGMIKPKDTFFKVDLFLVGKKTATDFVHKSCRETQFQSERELKNFVSNVSDFAIKQGIIPEKNIEVVV